jgi:hypothetical protein
MAATSARIVRKASTVGYCTCSTFARPAEARVVMPQLMTMPTVTITAVMIGSIQILCLNRTIAVPERGRRRRAGQYGQLTVSTALTDASTALFST